MLSGLLAAIVSGLATWLLWARPGVIPLLDRPNERSLHEHPTPRTGGIAIAIGFTVGFVGLMAGLDPKRSCCLLAPPFDLRLAWLVALAIPLFVTSLWSDWRELRPVVRLVIQLAVATALVVAGGLASDAFAWVSFDSPVAGLGLAVLAILTLVWMMNLYNFMDGMDGFAGGMTVIGFGSLAATMPYTDVAQVATVVVGAALGFLVHNFPPARIFMGDTASIPLGYLSGALSLYAVVVYGLSPWQPVLIFSPFIVDATATLLRRLVRGERVWRPHRQHAYQRLVLAGWSHRRTVIWEYAVMLAAGLSALLYGHSTAGERQAVLVGWAAIYVLLGALVRRIERSAGVGAADPGERR